MAMADWIIILGLTLAAGMAIPIGGALAWVERIRPRWLENELRHSVVAFGGGALLSAVALVLVPEGIRETPIWLVALSLAAGGVAFLQLDLQLDRHGASASQLVAMLADFLPEAIAMGAAFASGSSAGMLLALLIALQNLPEGFNAYREVGQAAHFTPRKTLAVFFGIALLGPVAGLAGYFLLASHTLIVSCLMLFAAGGILYLTFQDIAPQARLERHWAPPLGAVLGFLLGTIGHMVIGG